MQHVLIKNVSTITNELNVDKVCYPLFFKTLLKAEDDRYIYYPSFDYIDPNMFIFA